MSAVQVNPEWHESHEATQGAICYPACFPQHKSGTAHPLTPYALVGQRIALAPELAGAIESQNAIYQKRFIADHLSSHFPIIQQLHSAGIVSDNLLAQLTTDAGSGSVDAFKKGLCALLTDSVEAVYNKINAVIDTAFSSHPELAGYVQKTKETMDLFTLGILDSEHYQLEEPAKYSLVMQDSNYLESHSLELDCFTPEEQRYAFGAAKVACRGGGGVTSDELYSYEFGELTDAVTEDSIKWLHDLIDAINATDEDDTVGHLFDASAHEGTAIETLLQYIEYSHVLMDGEPDEIERDDLIEALLSIGETMDAIHACNAITPNITFSVDEFLTLEQPATELGALIRSVMEAAEGVVTHDFTTFNIPEDMCMPFGFVLWPTTTAAQEQSSVVDGIYEQSMNTGENFETYFIDLAKEQWLENVVSFSFSVFVAGLLITITNELAAKTKSSAIPEAE